MCRLVSRKRAITAPEYALQRTHLVVNAVKNRATSIWSFSNRHQHQALSNGQNRPGVDGCWCAFRSSKPVRRPKALGGFDSYTFPPLELFWRSFQSKLARPGSDLLQRVFPVLLGWSDLD